MQADEAIVLADRLQGLNANYRQRLHEAHATVNALALVDLFVSPYITIGMVQDRLNVTHPTARSTIRALEQHGILTEPNPDKKWGKIFVGRKMLFGHQWRRPRV